MFNVQQPKYFDMRPLVKCTSRSLVAIATTIQNPFIDSIQYVVVLHLLYLIVFCNIFTKMTSNSTVDKKADILGIKD